LKLFRGDDEWQRLKEKVGSPALGEYNVLRDSVTFRVLNLERGSTLPGLARLSQKPSSFGMGQAKSRLAATPVSWKSAE
jgi:hypothetical protein